MPFGRSHLGSLRQKCDPDRRDQNSHKNHLCFFTHQTFSIFIHFAVTWGPDLDPCCKSVILTSAIKIHIKVVYAFFNQHAFFIFIYFAATWCPTLGPCCRSVILTGVIKIHIKVGYVFLPSRHFPFSFLWLSLGVPTWILATKVRS